MYVCVCIQWNLLIKDTFRTSRFVLKFVERLSSSEVILLGGSPLSECPLSEVLLYVKDFWKFMVGDYHGLQYKWV